MISTIYFHPVTRLVNLENRRWWLAESCGGKFKMINSWNHTAVMGVPFCWSLGVTKFKAWKKCLKRSVLLHKSSSFRHFFFRLWTWWFAISRPVEVGIAYIPQKKALLPIVWKKFWNWTNFCHGRLQTSFSRWSPFLAPFY